jgi:hypothetical protein
MKVVNPLGPKCSVCCVKRIPNTCSDSKVFRLVDCRLILWNFDVVSTEEVI